MSNGNPPPNPSSPPPPRGGFWAGVRQGIPRGYQAGVQAKAQGAPKGPALRAALKEAGESPVEAPPPERSPLKRAGDVAQIVRTYHPPKAPSVGNVRQATPFIPGGGGGVGGVNRPIVISVVLIAVLGTLHAHLTGEGNVTRSLVGAILLLIFLSILDLFGDPFSTIAGGLAMLALVTVFLLDFPVLLSAFRTLVPAETENPPHPAKGRF